MPKLNSKKTPATRRQVFRTGYRQHYSRAHDKIWTKKNSRLRLHRSFRRSYREDYVRELKVPGLLYHTIDTFRYLFKNWKLFLPLLIFAVAFYILLVGIMNENTYVQFQQSLDDTSASIGNGELGNFAKAGLLLVSTITTGGLNSNLTEVQQIFAVIIFLIIWLVTIYLLRHILAGHKVKLRDGFYNALTPLISTFCVLLIAFIQAIPILIVIITYSAAVSTNFLATPFYALVYFIFAALMIILSLYLLSSTLIALIAVTAPGMYPMVAMRTASDLMASRRIRFIIRLIFLFIALIVVWVIIMLPIILLDLWLKGIFDWLSGVPFIPVALLIMTCFTFIYISAYLYLYYRRLLAYDDGR